MLRPYKNLDFYPEITKEGISHQLKRGERLSCQRDF
jgi:hypothetical protein